MSDGHAGVPAGAPRNPLGAAADYATQVLAVVDSEARKLRHDALELLSRAVQPVLWLVLFGAAMAQVRGLSSGSIPYLDFLAPGILAQSVLFVAIFYGVSAIWERDLGILQRYMVSPAPRSALVVGKALASSMRALPQAVVVYVCAALMGVGLDFQPARIVLVVILVALGSGLFSTFSLIIACIVKTRERFMGVGQILTMPIFFASNAIYPLAVMPAWLKAVSLLNPLTYAVDGLRSLMLRDGQSTFGLGRDFAALLIVAAALVVIATRLYPRLTR